jgi:tetratricopeptide (TPR) repeat protein
MTKYKHLSCGRLSACLALFAALLGSCLNAPPALENVLVEALSSDDSRSGFPAAFAFDGPATKARARALESPTDAGTQIAAARALFLAADERIQRATLDYLDSLANPSLEDALSADDHLSGTLKVEVESLTLKGLRFAEIALEISPTDRDALLYRALHTTVLAWAIGPGRAVLQGLANKASLAIAECALAGEEHLAAAPLRIRGRFLYKAPWPLGDLTRATQCLRLAVKVAPVSLNLLFLGDALYAVGEAGQALDSWKQAASAESDPDSAPLGAYHRESARRRVLLVR